MMQMNLSTKQKETHRHRKQTYQRGSRGGIKEELGINKCIALHIKKMDKSLLYSTWTILNILGETIMEKNIKKNIHMYMYIYTYMYMYVYIYVCMYMCIYIKLDHFAVQ